MAEKLEDLNLPNATVVKIIKEAIPENVGVAKDARAALSRAASIFVLYVTSQAIKEAHKANRKSLLGNDIIQALEELEFEEFVEPLHVVLEEFRDNKRKKKLKKAGTENDAEMVDEIEEHEDTADIEEVADDDKE